MDCSKDYNWKDVFKRKFFLVIAISLLSGCSTVVSMRSLNPTMEIVNIPALNMPKEAELGDTIVSKGILYTYSGMELLNEVRSSIERRDLFGGYIVIPPGELIAKGEDSSCVYYFSDQIEFYGRGTNIPYKDIGGLKVSKIDGTIELFKKYSGGWLFSTIPNVKPKYKLKKIRAVEQRNFQQELLYNGKVGNSVKFMYREISNDLMRPAFTQEIQYDLSESKIVGFKGARIEIIEATNTHLRYKIIQSFTDSH